MHFRHIAKSKNQRRMAIAQWRHHHLLSGRAVCRRLLSCQLCFIQLHHREEIPAQAEPSAIMSFGTSALVAAFGRRSGADGLIGSRPCGAPSGWSTGRKKMNAAGFFYSLLIFKGCVNTLEGFVGIFMEDLASKSPPFFFLFQPAVIYFKQQHCPMYLF